MYNMPQGGPPRPSPYGAPPGGLPPPVPPTSLPMNGESNPTKAEEQVVKTEKDIGLNKLTGKKREFDQRDSLEAINDEG